jgi:hypothetical protein
MKLLTRGKPSNSNGSITIWEMGAEAAVSKATGSRVFAGPNVIVYELLITRNETT